MTLRTIALLMPLVLFAAQEPKPAEAKKEEPKQETKAEAAATPDAEKTWSGWVEVGARWRSDVSGDMNTYRSIVNLTEGFRMPSMDVNYKGLTGGRLQTFRLSAGNWGDPFLSLIHI